MNSVDMENVRKYMAIIHLGGFNQKIKKKPRRNSALLLLIPAPGVALRLRIY